MGCVPELRFKKFSKKWEKKKLEEIADINPKSENLPDSFIYIDLESVENGLLKQKNQIFKENAPSRAQRILEIEDILFQTVRPYQKNNLFFNFDDSFYVSSTGYAQLRAIENPNFLFQIIHKETFVNEVLKRCTGTSYPAINSNDLKKISLNFPLLEEQEKIANFLSKVDEKIAILEDKLQLWETYKKGIMEQLFSQQLRFKDDEGNSYPDWEEKKLGTVCEIQMGQSPSSKNYTENPEDIILIQGNADLIKGRVVPRIFTTEITKTSKPDDIIMTVRAPVGDLAINEFNACIGRGVCSINANEFIYYLLDHIKEKKLWGKFSQGSTIDAVSSKDIKNLTINIPSIEEQEKIANFLTNIDEKIQKIANELKNNKDFKEG